MNVEKLVGKLGMGHELSPLLGADAGPRLESIIRDCLASHQQGPTVRTISYYRIRGHPGTVRRIHRRSERKYDRAVAMFCEYFGIGMPENTQERIGERWGLTKTRVGQSVAYVTDVLCQYHKEDIWYAMLEEGRAEDFLVD